MKLYLTYESSNGKQFNLTAYGEKAALRDICALVQKSNIVLAMSLKDTDQKSKSSVSTETDPF